MKDIKLTLRYTTSNGGWAEIETWFRLGEEFRPTVPADWKLEWAKITEYGDDEMRCTSSVGVH